MMMNIENFHGASSIRMSVFNDPRHRLSSGILQASRFERILFSAVAMEQAAKIVPHRRFVHKLVVGIIRAIARPDFGAGRNILLRDENKIGIPAELADAGVLKIGLDAVDLLRREVDAADVAAEILAVEKTVGFG